MRDGTSAARIKTFVASLRAGDWSQFSVDERWIGYLFHITSLENALSIVRQGHLLSRTGAIETGCLHHDGASKAVIDQTDSFVQECARLYFRPRVPTFFHNEGFISQDELRASRYAAHIPVPIALIFDLPSVLALDHCQFSDGNMGSRAAKRMDTFAEFCSLPFGKIYSTGPMSADDKEELRLRRHAEVLVPDHLELSPHLVCIACRSEAELKTLKHLLSKSLEGRVARERFDPLMRISTNGSVFEAKRPFVRNVRQSGSTVSFELNPTTRRALSDKYQFRVQVKATSNSNRIFVSTDQRLPLEGAAGLRIRGIEEPDTEMYFLELLIDGSVAYAAEHRWVSSAGAVL